ncbi:hypothetical protein PIROE2DRAFT_8880 [Piromyces sp. E2]|nr:hypothetical protein PIROE2DRAFT_8880 [Piromyces sp. E2]|eukprot:OUM64329.1 hypothetical protein PIROE2DRAFT_8880 [Piromyces sp. E2]
MNYNTFNHNYAYNFGGAIYSKYNQLYLTKANNNSIIQNVAGVTGGGIFSPNLIEKNMFDVNHWIIQSNTVNSFENNYSTNPAYIVLETKIKNNKIQIISGNYFPLVFTLYDEYDNIIEDITKYYSSLSLILSLTENDEEEIIENFDELNYHTVGNICTFINGRCELNNFRIFANPDTYFLKVSYENYNGFIKKNFDTIEIKVSGCNKNQYKKYNNKILYCENPTCHPDCPVDISAICIPSNSSNLLNNNECKCLPGWIGISKKNFKTYNINNNNNDDDEDDDNEELIDNNDISYKDIQGSSIDENNHISTTFIKKIKTVHSVFLEIIVVYMITTLIIISLVLYYKIKNSSMNSSKNNGNIMQSFNGDWFYQCDLEKPDLLLDL